MLLQSFFEVSNWRISSCHIDFLHKIFFDTVVTIYDHVDDFLRQIDLVWETGIFGKEIIFELIHIIFVESQRLVIRKSYCDFVVHFRIFLFFNRCRFLFIRKSSAIQHALFDVPRCFHFKVLLHICCVLLLVLNESWQMSFLILDVLRVKRQVVHNIKMLNLSIYFLQKKLSYLFSCKR